MVETINLRQFRKQKKRTERTIHAEENRHRFGRTKLEKLFDKKETLKAQKFLDQNRLSSDE
ncbi:conserved protein of unknown function [Bartonella clarridgeiae 73]|uniref:DUF4169 family protein n=1 Tax=Bartonella clarridgeiae (strain CCUG 45776 / CIP 104772 / 73) TaxID=696125 RepID=E6YIH1_BARC7|nr:DUF4169 family protein [Bartonella clarridgeiae]WCR54774.1 MAG: putative coiled-coil protein [Bartonella clarridgeiae]CBI76659.1 conserved protein of unknown function [Bartonella clarridgeiae 73]